MSFSAGVKEELLEKRNAGRHCDIAELSALINICGVTHRDALVMQTENILIIKRIFYLITNTFNIKVSLSVVKKNKNSGRQYSLKVSGKENIGKILSSTGIKPGSYAINPLVVSSACCKKAYISGAFLAAGSLSDPEKTYHVEFVFQNHEFALAIMKMINFFELSSKALRRKDYFIVYLKDSDQISDLFKIIEANGAMMELENILAFRDMNNKINRKANFDTANYDKTVSASANQVLDIQFIIESRGLSYLSESLQQIAELRLRHTEASLKELGELLSPTVSKSGVNHRFRKISEIADELRGGNN